MKTDTPEIVKQFYSVINKKYLTEEIYNALLKRFDLDKVDLDEQQHLIDIKQSPLTYSRRLAVPEFIILRQMLREKKAEEELAKQKLEAEASSFAETGNDNISSIEGVEVVSPAAQEAVQENTEEPIEEQPAAPAEQQPEAQNE